VLRRGLRCIARYERVGGIRQLLIYAAEHQAALRTRCWYLHVYYESGTFPGQRCPTSG